MGVKQMIHVAIHNNNVFKQLITALKQAGIKTRRYSYLKDPNIIKSRSDSGDDARDVILHIGRSPIPKVRSYAIQFGIGYFCYDSIESYVADEVEAHKPRKEV